VVFRMIRSIAVAVVILTPIGALAQTSTSPTASTAQPLKPAELDQLVAPIALYPDKLLSEVLMASAYPLEVVQAQRWFEANKNLKGDELRAAVDKQPWDESIKSLVAAPSVLEMMNTNLDWTQKLGDAVVAQQADVMDAIQRLRAKAQSNKMLTSTKEQTVKVEQVQGKQVIAIEPTEPNTVYVPYYDPSVVYGAWPYADYPPYYFAAPPYLGAFIATGLAFGAGYALGSWGGYWNGGVNWGGGNITINRPGHPIAGPGNRWQPRVEHRQRAANRAGRQQLNSRGSRGQQVLKPGAGRANLGERHRPSHRASVAHRGPSKRPSAAAHRGARHHAAPRHGGRGHASMGRRSMHRGGGMRGGRGGRRSDMRLKHDIILLGHLDNGLGFYRFSYNGSDKPYVGVMAQEVQQVMPQAVARGRDGYMRVYYDKLGLKFESYNHWIGSGAQIPAAAKIER
jgi:hypothetical protein